MLFTEEMLDRIDRAREAREDGGAYLDHLSEMGKKELFREALELYKCWWLIAEMFDSLHGAGLVKLQPWSLCWTCEKRHGLCLFGGEQRTGRVIRCQEYECLEEDDEEE